MAPGLLLRNSSILVAHIRGRGEEPYLCRRLFVIINTYIYIYIYIYTYLIYIYIYIMCMEVESHPYLGSWN